MSEIETELPSDTMSKLLKRINATQDVERLEGGVYMLNVFNYAIRNAGRTDWTVEDYRAFIIALAALDKVIGSAVIPDTEPESYAPGKRAQLEARAKVPMNKL